jgi:hypothetical protein
MTGPHLDQIKATLIDLVGGMNAADTARMLRGMERLDGLVAAHKRELDPQLVHFLERRSYAKAMDFVGGVADIPSGTCAPKS